MAEIACCAKISVGCKSRADTKTNTAPYNLPLGEARLPKAHISIMKYLNTPLVLTAVYPCIPVFLKE
jgi:hypothetical protein